MWSNSIEIKKFKNSGKWWPVGEGKGMELGKDTQKVSKQLVIKPDDWYLGVHFPVFLKSICVYYVHSSLSFKKI